MPHIVIDARIISSTTGRYVERLLHYLEEIDTENSYTVLVKKKDMDYWKPTNPRFSVKVADFKNYSFNEQLGYLRFLKRLDADLVHFCQPEQPVLYRGNKVTTIHDLTLLKTYNSDKNWLVFHFKQLVGRFVFRSVVKHSRFVISPTDFTKRELLQRFSVQDEKIVRTYLAAETKTAAMKQYALPTDQYLLFVGQQSDYKNVQRLAEAHQQLVKAHPDLWLVLVGKIDGPARKNKALFEENHYKNILFTGFVEDEELNWLYANTSAYVFPSLMEGFGLPGLEAMLHGAPVASSNATCLPEVYGDAAHYFNPLNSNDMSKAIEEIITDGALRKQLIKTGAEQAARYSWKKTAEETLEVYKQALKNSSGR